MTALRTHLELGRVANLPTVWSDTLAAAALSGAVLGVGPTLAALIGLSLLYTGGMYLNDAFDAGVDARERPERPIPSGRATVEDVKLYAVWLFVGGAVFLAAARIAAPGAAGSAGVAWIFATAALIAAIVLYDRSFSKSPYGPPLMGLCRFLVFVVVALVLGARLPLAVLGGATLVFAWVVGISVAARGESGGIVSPLAWPLLALPPLAGLVAALDEPWVWLPLALLAAATAFAVIWLGRGRADDTRRAVGLLVASICLVDALLVARVASVEWVVALMICFGATLLLQRQISGS